MKPKCMRDSWYRALEFMFKSSQYQHLMENIVKEHEKYKICPEPKDVFKAFSFFDFSDTRVVMVFLSPYQYARPDNELYATGLATAIPDITYMRDSFKFLKEGLENDYPDEFSTLDCTLEGWAKQGILLLNPSLTVRLNGDPKGHLMIWSKFTKMILQVISSRLTGVIFVPFGTIAREYTSSKIVNRANHYVLDDPKIPHPAARAWKEKNNESCPPWLDVAQSNVFKRIDEKLELINGEKINWYL